MGNAKKKIKVDLHKKKTSSVGLHLVVPTQFAYMRQRLTTNFVTPFGIGMTVIMPVWYTLYLYMFVCWVLNIISLCL